MKGNGNIADKVFAHPEIRTEAVSPCTAKENQRPGFRTIPKIRTRGKEGKGQEKGIRLREGS